MTKLLVSVRSAEEAEIAVEEGVDLIDVKEPNRGSLGAADDATLLAIVASVARRVPLSAARGELLEATSSAALPAGFEFAKFGLAGCREERDWVDRWRLAIDALPRDTAAVAVIYADWRSARAPAPARVVREAVALGCRAVLVDTFDKRRAGLFDHLAPEELGRLVRRVHKRGLLAVVAGGLGGAALRNVISAGPDCVAVRGAACAADRQSGLDRLRVRELVALVRSWDPAAGEMLATPKQQSTRAKRTLFH